MESLNTIPVTMRNMQEEDKNFILNSWLKSYRKSPAIDRMENAAYYHEQGRLIKSLLDGVNVLIACDPNDHTQIYGYLVSQRVRGVFVIHYLYVKLPFRNCGIAKMLVHSRAHALGKAVGCYTHHTAQSSKLAYKYRFIYNPFIAHYFQAYLNESQDVAVEA